MPIQTEIPGYPLGVAKIVGDADSRVVRKEPTGQPAYYALDGSFHIECLGVSSTSVIVRHDDFRRQVIVSDASGATLSSANFWWQFPFPNLIVLQQPADSWLVCRSICVGKRADRDSALIDFREIQVSFESTGSLRLREDSWNTLAYPTFNGTECLPITPLVYYAYSENTRGRFLLPIKGNKDEVSAAPDFGILFGLSDSILLNHRDLPYTMARTLGTAVPFVDSRLTTSLFFDSATAAFAFRTLREPISVKSAYESPIVVDSAERLHEGLVAKKRYNAVLPVSAVWIGSSTDVEVEGRPLDDGSGSYLRATRLEIGGQRASVVEFQDDEATISRIHAAPFNVNGADQKTKLYTSTRRLKFHLPLPQPPHMAADEEPAHFEYSNPSYASNAILSKEGSLRAAYYGLRLRGLQGTDNTQVRFDATYLKLAFVNREDRHGDVKRRCEFMGGGPLVVGGVQQDSRLGPQKFNNRRVVEIPTDQLAIQIDADRTSQSAMLLDTGKQNNEHLLIHREALTVLGPPLGSRAYDAAGGTTRDAKGRFSESMVYTNWQLELPGDMPSLAFRVGDDGVFPMKGRDWPKPFRTRLRGKDGQPLNSFKLLDQKGARLELDPDVERLLSVGRGLATKAGNGDDGQIVRSKVEKPGQGADKLLYGAIAAGIGYAAVEKFVPPTGQVNVEAERISHSIDKMTGENANLVVRNGVDDIQILYSAFTSDNAKRGIEDFIKANVKAGANATYKVWPAKASLGVLLSATVEGREKYCYDIARERMPRAQPVFGWDWSDKARMPYERLGWDPADLLGKAKEAPAIWPQLSGVGGPRLDPSAPNWKGFIFRDMPLHLIIDDAVWEEIEKRNLTLLKKFLENLSLMMEYGWFDEWNWTLVGRTSREMDFTPDGWESLIRFSLLNLELAVAGGKETGAQGTLRITFPKFIRRDNGEQYHVDGTIKLNLDPKKGEGIVDKIEVTTNADLVEIRGFPGFKSMRLLSFETDFKWLTVRLELQPEEYLSRTLPSPKKFELLLSYNFSGDKPAADAIFILPAERDSSLYDKFRFTVQSIRMRFPSGTMDELQEIAIVNAVPTSGSFRLGFKGQTTDVKLDAQGQVSKEMIQAALVGLSTIGSQNVECGGGPLPQSPVEVRFTGNLSGQDVDEVSAQNIDLNAGTPRVRTLSPGGVGNQISIYGTLNLDVPGFSGVGLEIVLYEVDRNWKINLFLDQIGGRLNIGSTEIEGTLHWSNEPRDTPERPLLGDDPQSFSLAQSRDFWGVVKLKNVAGKDYAIWLRIGASADVTYWVGAINAFADVPLGAAQLKEAQLLIAHNADFKGLVRSGLSDLSNNKFNELIPGTGSNAGWLKEWSASSQVGTLVCLSGFLEFHEAVAAKPGSRNSQGTKKYLTYVAFTDNGMARAQGTVLLLGVRTSIAISYQERPFRLMASFQVPKIALTPEKPEWEIQSGQVTLGVGEKFFLFNLGFYPKDGPPGLGESDLEIDWAKSVKVKWDDVVPINTFWGGFYVKWDDGVLELGQASRAGFVYESTMLGGIGGFYGEIAVGGAMRIKYFAHNDRLYYLPAPSKQDSFVPLALETSRRTSAALQTSSFQTSLAKGDPLATAFLAFQTTLEETLAALDNDRQQWSLEVVFFGDIVARGWAKVMGVEIASIELIVRARFYASGPQGNRWIAQMYARMAGSFKVKIGCFTYEIEYETTYYLVKADRSLSPQLGTHSIALPLPIQRSGDLRNA